MVTCAARATSRNGLICSRPTGAPSSRPAARLPRLRTTYAAWHLPSPPRWQREGEAPAMTHGPPLTLQAQLAYVAAIGSPCPDWRAVAELFRVALPVARKREPKSERAPQPEVPPLADYNVDRIKLKCR